MLSFIELNADSKETIVLLHALGEDSSFYAQDGDIPSLLRDFHFLIPDLPGAVKSQNTRLTSLSAAADQVRELIVEFARGGKAHVVGFDVGGLVALTLAQLHAARLLSCVAINPKTEEIKAPLRWRPVLSLAMANAVVALTPLRLFPTRLVRSSFYALLNLPTDPERLNLRLRNLTYRTFMDYGLALRDFKLHPLGPQTLLLFVDINLAEKTASPPPQTLVAQASLLCQGSSQGKGVVGVWTVPGWTMQTERFAAVIKSWAKREPGIAQCSGWADGENAICRYQF